jgi:acetyl-CoA carboxylase biotin carboxyl carrier protein
MTDETAGETAGDRNAADVAFIRALAELLQKNDLTEIAVEREYGEDDVLKVRVSRQVTYAAASPVVASPVVASPVVAPPVVAPPAAPAAAAAEAAPAAPPADPADLPGVVTSPMVGTAYLCPEPGAAPFVTVGQQVSAGQTLLIIEAMKTMNQIPAPHGGIVRRILVGDGTPVEYGAPLMIID